LKLIVWEEREKEKKKEVRYELTNRSPQGFFCTDPDARARPSADTREEKGKTEKTEHQ